jgi:hypothetical protein
MLPEWAKARGQERELLKLNVGVATVQIAWYPPRMEHAIYTPAHFSPKEVEKITELSTSMQRDWRRRGFIESQSGHAKFDPFEVATIWVAKVLSDRGIGPTISQEIAPICGAGLVIYALSVIDSWEGDHCEALSWASLPEPQSLPDGIEALLEKADVNFQGLDRNWGFRASWLAWQVMQSRGINYKPAPFFAWYADGSHEWASEPQAFFQDASFTSKYHGAVIILDLESMANEFSMRCGRALVHVELPRDQDGGVVAPIEYGSPVSFSVTGD